MVGQGLEKTDAEKLGTTVGLDVFQLFEVAADKYLEDGNVGRAQKYVIIVLFLFFYFVIVSFLGPHLL